MGRYAYRDRRRERAQGGCMRAFFALVFVGCLAVLVYTFAIRPALTRAVADAIAGPVPTLMPQGQAGTAVAAQAGAVIPDAVAALPPGEIVVSEADVNGFLAARPDAIAPLDSATMRFTGGLAVAEIAAYGMSSTASVGLTAQDGKLLVTSTRIDGPLALVISGDELAQTLADRLNAELATQNRRIEAVRVEEGQIVLITS